MFLVYSGISCIKYSTGHKSWPTCSFEIKHIVSSKQTRSTDGCSRLKRSVDMTSSGKNGLNIRTNASPKWDRTRCPEE